jgi:hypothetical protein
MSIVKRQHYVWRKYLQAWSYKGQIFTLLKEKNEVKNIGLMGVAQERYFYRLYELSNIEFDLLDGLVSKSHPSVQAFLTDLILPYRVFTDIKRKTKGRKPNEDFETELKKIEINTLEKIHGKFETNGAKLISCRSKEDLKQIISNPDDKNSALIYLSVQYFRTQKIKTDLINTFKVNERVDISKFWNIVTLILSFNTARSMAVDERIKFRFYENQTAIPFMTGDQPVLNIKQSERDEYGNVKFLEFFYPLSPNNAISVHFEESQTLEIEQILINEPLVEYFNDFVIENSLKFSFCNNEEYLSKKKRT